MSKTNWVWLPVAAVSSSVYAATYFNAEQAQQAIFPGAKLEKAFLTLSAAQLKEIEHHSDVNVRNTEIQLWKVEGGGYFIVDEVVGKHEFITYAIGLHEDGSVKQVEIMQYVESYGYQVRNADWLKQFVGKTSAAPLTLENDIKNISGATLSCRHITDGIKRILRTYDVAIR